jgi:hypothetical protein
LLATSAAPHLADDAVEAALLTSGFRQCKTDVAAIDENTTAGRQRILDVALMSGEVILKRLIFTGSQNLARRDPLLALLLSIRPYLPAYLGYCQAVEPLTGTVPERAKEWIWGTSDGAFDPQLEKFLKFNFVEMDWLAGVYSLKAKL